MGEILFGMPIFLRLILLAKLFLLHSFYKD